MLSISSRVITSGGLMTMVSRTARTIKPLRMQMSRMIGPALPSLPPKRLFVPFFATISTRADQSEGARFAHQRMARNLRHALRQIRPGFVRRALDQLLALDDLDVLQCDGGTRRVARIRVAVDELARTAQRLDDRCRHADCGDRQIAGRESFRHRHHVRLDAEVLEAEPFAQSSEAADDLVADQQDAVLAADRLDACASSLPAE